MVDWTPGAIFSVVVIVVFESIVISTTYWFYSRRDVQPIKARQPILVVITDVIWALFVLGTCLQRIIENSFPCSGLTWVEYIGVIFLGNIYIWRCWILYVTYSITQSKLNNSDMSTVPSYLRNRYYISISFFTRIAIALLLLLLPCAVAIKLDSGTQTGDGGDCQYSWARSVLVVIVALYILVLLFFAYQLRQVVDGFQIKNELKFTGVFAVIGIIPWLLFNEEYASQNSIFPYSTLSILVAIIGAFSASTLWPLYRSIYRPPKIVTTEIPENLESLGALISTKEGFDSFRKFLTAEFSVENLLFFADIEDLRRKIREGADINTIKSESKRLLEKYIDSDSPFQVNLADRIVHGISEKMKILEEEDRIDAPAKPDDDILTGKPIDFPTIFDEAQLSIFNLMDSDSFQRYKSSKVYGNYVEEIKIQLHKNSVLREMDII